MASVHQNRAPANGTIPGSAPVVFPAGVAALYPPADAPQSAPSDPPPAKPRPAALDWPYSPDIDDFTWEDGPGPDPDETCNCDDPECRLCSDRQAEVLWGCIVSEMIDRDAPTDPESAIRNPRSAMGEGCIISEEIDPSAPGAADREPSPDAPRLAGYQVVAMEAERYRALGTSIGDLIAATLDDLAHEWRFLGGQSVDQFLDRRLQMELWYSRREAEAEMERGTAW
jgi:hypothetical protein